MVHQRIIVFIIFCMLPQWSIGQLPQDQRCFNVLDNISGITTLEKLMNGILYEVGDYTSHITDIPREKLLTKLNADNPYKATSARVHIGQNLNAQEQAFVNKRKKFTCQALNNLLSLQQTEQKSLTIALCLSGGGMRASIATLGFLMAAQDVGFLDVICYMSALSGSTWSLGTWLSSNLDLGSFKEQLKKNLQRNIRLSQNMGTFESITDSTQILAVIKNFLTKFICSQPTSLIDLGGALLTNNLLYPSETRQLSLLSSQLDSINKKNLPFPLYCTAEPLPNGSYHWYENTPTEVKNLELQAAIPTWAFGRKFDKGSSIPIINQYPPEQSLGYFLSICGSALAINLKECIRELEQAGNLSELEKRVLHCLVTVDDYTMQIGEQRVMTAKVPNFLYGLTSERPVMTLIDAGIDFTLPFPPLLQPERHIDIIIALDMSAELRNAPALAQAQSYAQAHNLPFPNVSTAIGLEQQPINIFKGNSSTIPTIIYIPFTNNCVDRYCGIFNVHYSPQEFDYVFSTAYVSFMRNKQIILETLKEAALQK